MSQINQRSVRIMHFKSVRPFNWFLVIAVGVLIATRTHAAQVDVDSAAKVCAHYFEQLKSISTPRYLESIRAYNPAQFYSDSYLGNIASQSVEQVKQKLSKLKQTSQSLVEYDQRDLDRAKAENQPDSTIRNYKQRLAHDQFIECMSSQALLSISGGASQGKAGGSTVTSPTPTPEAPLNQQSAVEQSIALAQQNQSRGDEQARKDGRKRSNPEYEAHNCLTLVDMNNPASFGGLHNSCSYKVNFNYCVLRPKPSSWATAFDCEKQSFGGVTAGANGGKGAGLMKGGEAVHFFACREPALVLDTRFNATLGRVEGRCRVIGS